ncbi:MAG: hypothetical protein H3C49_02380 [Alphaproteobacteria bacterium]|nr:hypothetical protein [Alphaproteobacteria bacterium]
MTNKDGFDLELEDETSEEEFDDVSLDDAQEPAAEEKPAKKKSGGGALVSVIALLAVLGGGGFAAVKYLGVQLPFDIPGLTQSAQAPAAQTPAAPTMTASADLPAGDLPPQPAVPEDAVGALPDANAISPAETAGHDGSINAPWDSLADAGEAPANDAVDAGASIAAPADTDTSNIVDPFAAMPTEQAADMPATSPAVPADTASAPDASNIVDPFAAMPAEQATQAVPAADSAVDTAAPVLESAVAPAVDNTADKARFADLEKQLAESKKALAASEKAKAQAESALAKKSEELSQAQADLKAAQKHAKDAAAAVKAASEDKPAAAVATSNTAAPKAAKPAASVKKVSWVLRSAKPGMAWVSEKGSSEMRTVSVGDTLAGIGKVTSIAADAQGRWVVNGTRGTINQ